MGIYYFAVDYTERLQMEAPSGYAIKFPGVFYPGHPLPCMIVMKNIQGYNFEIINDVTSYEEHSFTDITQEAFKELKDHFPEYQWKEG
jgi:hypothetical protein